MHPSWEKKKKMHANEKIAAIHSLSFPSCISSRRGNFESKQSEKRKSKPNMEKQMMAMSVKVEVSLCVQVASRIPKLRRCVLLELIYHWVRKMYPVRVGTYRVRYE
jgi:hypothetical protein